MRGAGSVAAVATAAIAIPTAAAATDSTGTIDTGEKRFATVETEGE